MSGGRFPSVDHLTVWGRAMLFGKKYPMPAVVFLIQRLALVLVVLTGAMFTQLAGSRPAQAGGGEGYLGWASHGAYYGSSAAACHVEWEYYGLNNTPSQFIGSTPYMGKFYSHRCLWTTNFIGAILPNSVSLFCDYPYVAVSEDVCQKDPALNFDPCTPQGGPTEGIRRESDGLVSNPIQLSSGAKIERITDFATADGRLSVERAYHSLPQRWNDITIGTEPIGQTNGWGFGFSMELHLSGALNGTLFLPQGLAFFYSRSGSTFTPEVHGENYDYTVALVGAPPADWNTYLTTSSQWKVTQARTGRVYFLQTFPININDSTPDYDIARVVKIADADGYVQNLTYGPTGALLSITDSYGRSLGFTWRPFNKTALPNVPGSLPVPDVVEQITLPDGNKLAYTYDPAPTLPSTTRAKRLVSVTRKTASNVVIETVTYHYEDTRFPTQLTGITDSRGIRYATFAYDGQARAILSEHAGGVEKTTIAYSFAGYDRVATVTNPLGKTTVYTFSKPVGRNGSTRLLKSVAGQASASCVASNSSLTYVDNGFYGAGNIFLASETDEEGRVTKFTRDALGRPLTITRGFGTPLAVTETYTWNPSWWTPSRIVRTGLTLDYARNALGQLTLATGTDTTSQTVPYSTAGQTRSTAYTYSATGQLLTVDGPLAGAGDKVTYTYDPANGYVKTFTNELAQVTTVNSVNGRGQPTRITDANAVITDFTWSAQGWLASVNVAPGASQALTSFTYNAAGDMTGITRPGGATLTMAYDNARRLTSITNGAGESIVYTRDLMGNVTKTEVKAGASVVALRNQVFDELGRLIKTVGAASAQTWAFGYDKTDNGVSVTDPRGKVWSSGFDALNRLVTETEPGPNTVTLTRNPKGEVTEYKDPRNLITTYVRNGFGEVIRQSNPDTGITDYTYDARGLVTQIKDARLVIANMTYDNAGRILTRAFPAAAAEIVTFAYDSVLAGNVGKGRLTQVTDPAGNSKFVYDARGNLLSETRTIGTSVYAVSYAYDLADRLLTITYPSGRVVTYVRDAQGKVISVTTRASATAASVTLASNVKWQPMGGDKVFGQGNLGTATQIQALPGGAALGGVDLLQSLTYGNGLILWKNFSQDNELYQLIIEQGATKIINRFYNRADLTNVTGIIDGIAAANNESLGYNDAARLSSASGAYGTKSWTYDANGNRASETANGVLDIYYYPANSNKLVNVVRGSTPMRIFTYDAAGNVLQDLRGANAYNYAVNNAGRIRQMSLNTGASVVANYTYDGFQKLRIKVSTSPAATTHYVWDSFGHIIAETAGTFTREYIWLGDTPLAVNEGATLSYVHPDHLDRPVAMTTSSGSAVAWSAKYDPFGNVVTITNPTAMPLRFPGQYFQIEDGLSYNWHRNYDPTLGRYSQADPLGFVDGPGVYNYVLGSPAMGMDIGGLDTPAMGPYGPCWSGVCGWAGGKIRKPGYGYFDCNSEARGRMMPYTCGAPSLKCNTFVWDAAQGGGAPAGRMPDGRIPSAAEWGNPNSGIPGYSPLPPGERPQLGDIIGDGHHVGIYSPLTSGSPGTTSAASFFKGNGPVHNDWGFRDGQSVIIWRPMF
jgi:RHS repeat-associated protein